MLISLKKSHIKHQMRLYSQRVYPIGYSPKAGMIVHYSQLNMFSFLKCRCIPPPPPQKNPSEFLLTYWVGQKVCSQFSAPSYGQTRTRFLANPILAFSSFQVLSEMQWLKCTHTLSLCGERNPLSLCIQCFCIFSLRQPLISSPRSQYSNLHYFSPAHQLPPSIRPLGFLYKTEFPTVGPERKKMQSLLTLPTQTNSGNFPAVRLRQRSGRSKGAPSLTSRRQGTVFHCPKALCCFLQN